MYVRCVESVVGLGIKNPQICSETSSSPKAVPVSTWRVLGVQAGHTPWFTSKETRPLLHFARLYLLSSTLHAQFFFLCQKCFHWHKVCVKPNEVIIFNQEILTNAQSGMKHEVFMKVSFFPSNIFPIVQISRNCIAVSRHVIFTPTYRSMILIPPNSCKTCIKLVYPKGQMNDKLY